MYSRKFSPTVLLGEIVIPRIFVLQVLTRVHVIDCSEDMVTFTTRGKNNSAKYFWLAEIFCLVKIFCYYFHIIQHSIYVFIQALGIYTCRYIIHSVPDSAVSVGDSYREGISNK